MCSCKMCVWFVLQWAFSNCICVHKFPSNCRANEWNKSIFILFELFSGSWNKMVLCLYPIVIHLFGNSIGILRNWHIGLARSAQRSIASSNNGNRQRACGKMNRFGIRRRARAGAHFHIYRIAEANCIPGNNNISSSSSSGSGKRKKIVAQSKTTSSLNQPAHLRPLFNANIYFFYSFLFGCCCCWCRPDGIGSTGWLVPLWELCWFHYTHSHAIWSSQSFLCILVTFLPIILSTTCYLLFFFFFFRSSRSLYSRFIIGCIYSSGSFLKPTNMFYQCREMRMRLLGWYDIHWINMLVLHTHILYTHYPKTHTCIQLSTSNLLAHSASILFMFLRECVCVHHHSKSLKFFPPSHTHSQRNSTINNPCSKGNSMKVKLHVFIYTFIFFPLWSVVVILPMKNTLRKKYTRILFACNSHMYMYLAVETGKKDAHREADRHEAMQCYTCVGCGYMYSVRYCLAIALPCLAIFMYKRFAEQKNTTAIVIGVQQQQQQQQKVSLLVLSII